MNDFEDELSERLRSASSFNAQFANVISGMNHEVSPWLGSIANTNARLSKFLEHLRTVDDDSKQDIIEKCLQKVEKIEYAIEQATSVLSMMSRDVKRLQTYALLKCPISETVISWLQVTLVDQLIKSTISTENIDINLKSLEFSADHSPMLLSQVILNLAKNSVEHNPHMLEDLQIKVYGRPNKKELVYEDNGCGISSDLISKIFTPGITTKLHNSTSHGLGLSACMDYCIAMHASIWVESVEDEFVRFIIRFEHSYDDCDSEDDPALKSNLKNLRNIYKARKQQHEERGDNLW